MEEVVIEIPQGKLKGLKEKNFLGDVFFSFQGIPYAKPPIGSLRFKPPEPADPWEGLRDATKPGPVAPSCNIFSKTYDLESNEDCLFVNVFTKQNPIGNLTKLPVMVRIHGGAFCFGSGNRDFFGPEHIMHRDVVLVTFNYRLGPLGFLSLDTPDCSGNFGLKDQRVLLKWVQLNISFFGGDPANVTLMGESAGGKSADFLQNSQTTQGLFKRSIIQSGPTLGLPAYMSSREISFALGRKLGLKTENDAELLEFLTNATAEDLVVNCFKILTEIMELSLTESDEMSSFQPDLEPPSEDAVILEDSSTPLEERNIRDIPVMLGVCSREFLSLDNNVRPDFSGFTKDEDFQKFIPSYFKLPMNSTISLEIAKRIRDFYFKDGVTAEKFSDLGSDAHFNFGVHRTIKSRVSRCESPVYCYIFSYEGDRKFNGFPVVTEISGVQHMGDLFYLYSSKFLPEPEKDSPDCEFVMKLVNLLVDFATTGEPTKEVNWIPCDEKSMRYLDIDKEFRMKEGFFQVRMKFWDEIYNLVKDSL